MKKSRVFGRLSSFLLVFAWLFSAAPAIANDFVVTRYFSGIWDQPKQESQGIILQIIDQEEDGNPKAVAYWFTYGDDLDTSWYLAVGHVENEQVIMDLYTAYGVGFMEDESPDVQPVNATGTLVLTFKNCNHGTAAYELTIDEGEAEQGEFEIKRLAGLYNSRCSGGLSDNTPGHGKPLMLEVALEPVIEGSDAKGKARFWERADRSDLHVSVEHMMDDGLYGIRYCEADYPDALDVINGEGAAQFRSPQVENLLHLTKDPRDCTIEVYDGVGVVLTSGDDVLAEKEKGHGKDKDKQGTGVEIDMLNVSDAYPEAEGELKYQVKPDSTEFEVEVEDAPPGSYAFIVAGMEEGQIEVTPSGKGKLKFSDPQEDDKLPLTFAPPWDKIMEIRGPAPEETNILEATFPSEP
jgi:hypothetical protein